MTPRPLFLLLLLPACLPKPGGATSEASTDDDDALVLSKTLDAPHRAYPMEASVQPYCLESGYVAVDVPEGQPFALEVSVSAGCAHVSVRKPNSSNVDLPQAEVCAGTPATLEAAGQAGHTLIAVNETGACVGNTVELALR